jgi:hypothetical protein
MEPTASLSDPRRSVIHAHPGRHGDRNTARQWRPARYTGTAATHVRVLQLSFIARVITTRTMSTGASTPISAWSC